MLYITILQYFTILVYCLCFEIAYRIKLISNFIKLIITYYLLLFNY